MEFTGKITARFEPQTINKNGEWHKLVFLVQEVDCEHPQSMKCVAWNETADLVERLSMNGVYRFLFSIRMTAFENDRNEMRYVNEIKVWDVRQV